jgi:FkbM family methyltransferase
MRVSKEFVHLFHRLRMLRYVHLFTELRYGNKSYTIPIAKGIGYSHCVGHEGWLLKVMTALGRYFSQDKAFIDVGVNVGQSLLLLKSLYPYVPYAGFEPNPVCVEYSRQLIEVNNLQKTTIYPFGLSDKSTEAYLNFYHRNDDDSSASVVTQFRPEEVRQRRRISLVCGDELQDWEKIRPGIIKIDVEGAELEVITGLANVVAVYRPCIICEVLPVYSNSNTFRVNRQQSLQKVLVRHGYNIYQVDPTGSINKIDAFSVHATLDACNYLFMPEENDVFN